MPSLSTSTRRKSVGKESEMRNDETMKEIQEYDVLFEKTDEDPMTVAITLVAFSQTTADNVTMFNEKFSQAKSENTHLKDEIISLKE